MTDIRFIVEHYPAKDVLVHARLHGYHHEDELVDAAISMGAACNVCPTIDRALAIAPGLAKVDHFGVAQIRRQTLEVYYDGHGQYTRWEDDPDFEVIEIDAEGVG